jgi:hypothetical protein
MGLIQNGYRDICGSFRLYGATVHNSAVPQESVGNRHITGMNRNLTAGEGITDQKIGVPVGYRPPDTWIMPQKSGALGATGSRLTGTGSVASPGNLAGGLNAEAPLAGTGEINNAAMGLIMSAVASIAGAGGFTADMVGSIAAAAELAGYSTLSAPLGAIAGGLATLSGQGGVCCSDLRADGFMSADIAPATTVAADVIGRAVLDAVIENGLSLADVQRLLLAVAAGNATGLDSDQVFMAQDGNTERITGTVSGGTRTITGLNP